MNKRRKNKMGKPYCSVHQQLCVKHDMAKMKGEDCLSCVQEKQAKEHERLEIRKDKEEKERKKQELADKQAAKTKAPLTKKVKTIGGRK